MPDATALLMLLVGVALGLAFGWLLASRRAATDVATARALLTASQNELGATRERMRDELRAVAADVVRESRQDVLASAQDRVRAEVVEASAKLDERRREVDALIAPMREQLTKLADSTAALEKERHSAYNGLQQRLVALDEHTSKLTTALTSSSQVRGNWGEVQLRRLLEVAGLTHHVDYFEQTTTASGKRPDVVVRLPDGCSLPIDAKAPGASFMVAADLPAGTERDRLLAEHAKATRARVHELGSKDYQAEVDGDFDHVVMFIPSEAMAAAAFSSDPGLMEFALAKRVLVATPITLMGLLRTISLYWRQHALGESTREIHTVAQEMLKRTVTFTEHFASVGDALSKATHAYNATLRSYQTRVLPQGRRLEALGAATAGAEIMPAGSEIDVAPMGVRVDGESDG